MRQAVYIVCLIGNIGSIYGVVEVPARDISFDFFIQMQDKLTAATPELHKKWQFRVGQGTAVALWVWFLKEIAKSKEKPTSMLGYVK